MSEQAIPDDIREWAEQLGIRLRFSLAGINRAAATVWATDGAIARVNDAFADAILAERQKHDRPTSPDLQAEAEKRGRDEERARCKKIALDYPLTDVCSDHANMAVAFNASQNIAAIIDRQITAHIVVADAQEQA